MRGRSQGTTCRCVGVARDMATCSLVPSLGAGSGIGISRGGGGGGGGGVRVGDMKSTHVELTARASKMRGKFRHVEYKKESTRTKFLVLASSVEKYAARDYLQEIQASYSLLW